MKRSKRLAIARDRTRVEQRQEELRIVRLESCEVRQLADLMSDDEPEIPERVEKPSEQRFVRRPDRAGEQHEEVDVRMKAEVTPAVAAEREDRHRPLRRRRVEEQLPQQRVDAVRVAFERRPGRPRPAMSRAQLVAGGVECRPDCRAGTGAGDRVIDIGRTSPGPVGGVMARLSTTAIIVGIPVRLQLEGEAETDGGDDRRAARIQRIITEAVIGLDRVPERLELGAAVDIRVSAHRHRHDPPDGQIPELSRPPPPELVVIAGAQADLDGDCK